MTTEDNYQTKTWTNYIENWANCHALFAILSENIKPFYLGWKFQFLLSKSRPENIGQNHTMDLDFGLK